MHMARGSKNGDGKNRFVHFDLRTEYLLNDVNYLNTIVVRIHENYNHKYKIGNYSK